MKKQRGQVRIVEDSGVSPLLVSLEPSPKHIEEHPSILSSKASGVSSQAGGGSTTSQPSSFPSRPQRAPSSVLPRVDSQQSTDVEAASPTVQSSSSVGSSTTLSNDLQLFYEGAPGQVVEQTANSVPVRSPRGGAPDPKPSPPPGVRTLQMGWTSFYDTAKASTQFPVSHAGLLSIDDKLRQFNKALTSGDALATSLSMTTPSASSLATPSATSATPLSDGVVHVGVTDDLVTQFIKCRRDFFRTGVLFHRRNTPLERESLEASLRSSTVSGSSESGKIRRSLSHSVLMRPAISFTKGSALAHENSAHAKIQRVLLELQKMREMKRKQSTADIFTDLDVGSMRRDYSNNDATSSNDGTDSSAPHRTGTATRSALLHQLLKQQSDHLVSTALDWEAFDDEEKYEGNVDMIPDHKFVDRFTAPSLEALIALSQRLASTSHVKFSNVQVLTLTGCNIGDDGCFIVLQAIRFGSLKHVECLDLMYNQLTATSAFYMGVFLLVRPPTSMIDTKINGDFKVHYEQLHPPDAKQKALQGLAAKRTLRVGGPNPNPPTASVGASSNKQSSTFFLPFFDSSKVLVSQFFGNKQNSVKSFGGFGGRFGQMKNMLQAVSGMGGLTPTNQNRRASMQSMQSMTAHGLSPMPPSDGFTAFRVFGEAPPAIEVSQADTTEDLSDDESDDSLSDGSLADVQALLGQKPSGSQGVTPVASPRSPMELIAPSRSVGGSAQRRSVKQIIPAHLQEEVKQLQEREAKNAATSIVSLRLSWNDFDNDGMCLLSEWIACQSFLKELQVAYNDATDDGLVALRDALKNTTSVVSLNIEGNACEDGTAEALRATILYNRRLMKKTASGVDH